MSAADRVYSKALTAIGELPSMVRIHAHRGSVHTRSSRRSMAVRQPNEVSAAPPSRMEPNPAVLSLIVPGTTVELLAFVDGAREAFPGEVPGKGL